MRKQTLRSESMNCPTKCSTVFPNPGNPLYTGKPHPSHLLWRGEFRTPPVDDEETVWGATVTKPAPHCIERKAKAQKV